MTKIVGHRGAGGKDHQNTIPGFQKAKQMGVDAIELDVRVSRDNQFIVCHDPTVLRADKSKAVLSELTYSEIKKILLPGGAFVPLLRDVLEEIRGVPVIVDIKTSKRLPELCELIDEFPDTDFTFAAHIRPGDKDRGLSIIQQCKQLRPDIPAFVGRHYTPLGLMRSIKRHGADGLNLHYIWLNPITYRAVTKLGMQIQVYTVNNVKVARLLKRLYPGIWICTNNPDLFLEQLKSNDDTSESR